MPAASLILMVLAGILHVGFFVLESLLWKRPAVHRVYGMRSIEDAETVSFALFNQGFYNLFLALGTFVGVVVSARDDGDLLVIFCGLFMVGAALVLVASNRRLWRGALVQGALPAVALLIAAVA